MRCLRAAVRRRSVETLFRNTVEHAPSGRPLANRDGAYRHCNRAFCAMLGFSNAELDAVDRHPHGGGGSQSTTLGLEQAVARRSLIWTSSGAIWRDGGARVTTSLSSGGGQEPECSVEFTCSLPRARRWRSPCRAEPTLLATVIAELPLGLLACDINGKVTHYNRAAIELFGIPAEEARGSATRSPYPITSGVPPGRRRRCRVSSVSWRVPWLAPEVSDEEFIIVRPDRAMRTVLASSRRLVGPARLGAVVVVQDIAGGGSPSRSSRACTSSCCSLRARRAEVATNVLRNVGNVAEQRQRVGEPHQRAHQEIQIHRTCAGRQPALRALPTTSPRSSAVPRGGGCRPISRHCQRAFRGARGGGRRAHGGAQQHRAHQGDRLGAAEATTAAWRRHRHRGCCALVEDSLRINEGAFSRHGVMLVRDFTDVPPVQVDKHRVLQVLVNVIRNAKYACDEGPGTVEVRVADGVMSIAVIDARCIRRKTWSESSITASPRARCGHGFGLHSCALAAKGKDLGGSLLGEIVPGRARGRLHLDAAPDARDHPMADEPRLLTHHLLMMNDNPAIHAEASASRSILRRHHIGRLDGARRRERCTARNRGGAQRADLFTGDGYHNARTRPARK